MDLKELLGADYKENITADEVNAIFQKKFVDSGNYVSRTDLDNANAANTKTINDLKKQIKDKAPAEKQAEIEKQELLDKIAELEEASRNDKISMSKSKAEGTLNAIRNNAGVKENDKDFAKLIENISSEDTVKTSEVSTYIAKLVNDAYEKGKADTTKQNLGQMGNMVVGEGGKLVDKDEQFVKGLLSSQAVPTYKNSNFI